MSKRAASESSNTSSKKRKTIVDAVRAGDKELVESYLKDGADPNTVVMVMRDGTEKTLLQIASLNRDHAMQSLLLKYKADVNKMLIARRTPLWISASILDIEGVELLLKNGADPNITDRDNLTPIFISGIEGDFRKQQRILEVIKILVKYKANVNHYDNVHTTALWHAIRANNVNVALFLIKLTTGLDVKDRNGNTCLMFAAYRDNAEIVKALLDNGADPSIENSRGRTALNVAGIYSERLLKYKTPRFDNSTCAICLESVKGKEGEPIPFTVRLGCGHGFHLKCIGPSLTRASECPVCRTPVDTYEMLDNFTSLETMKDGTVKMIDNFKLKF